MNILKIKQDNWKDLVDEPVNFKTKYAMKVWDVVRDYSPENLTQLRVYLRQRRLGFFAIIHISKRLRLFEENGELRKDIKPIKSNPKKSVDAELEDYIEISKDVAINKDELRGIIKTIKSNLDLLAEKLDKVTEW